MLAQPVTPAKTTPPSRISHVGLAGDFEALAPVRRVGEELERAARDGDALVVLEIDGNRARPDIALAIVDLVRAARIPVAAYLADSRDHRVGAAQACVAAATGRSALQPGVVVHTIPGDTLADLMPDGADRERIGREFSGAVYARLREQGAPAQFARLLTDTALEGPPRDAWAIVPADAALDASLVFEDPGLSSGGSTVWRLVNRERSGAPSLELRAEQLTRLHAAGPSVSTFSAVPAAFGMKGLLRSRITIDFSLDHPRADVAALVTEADDFLRRAGEDLNLPKPPRRDISEDRYRSAAAAARERLAAARDRIGRCEKIVAEYPELTRTPAPGQTEVAGKPSAYATKWRSGFQKRTDQARTLEEKAATFDPAGRK